MLNQNSIYTECDRCTIYIYIHISHSHSSVLFMWDLPRLTPITGPQPSRKRKLLSRLCETVILESTGSSEAMTTSQQFKVGLYYPILDAFLMELNRRFCERNVEIMRAFRACSQYTRRPQDLANFNSSCPPMLVRHHQIVLVGGDQ